MECRTRQIFSWLMLLGAILLGAAPAGYTNFVWANCQHETLTWRVLNSIWIAEGINCPNCDVPLVVVSFDWQMGMLSFRAGRVVRHSLRSRRRFLTAEEEPLAGLASVLPPPLRPTHLQLWREFEIDWLRLSLGRGRVAQAAGQDG